MSEINVCGTVCAGCYCYGNICSGCRQCDGKVFFAGGSCCPIYDCAVNRKKLKNCGSCPEAPCEIWRSTRDPEYTDEEFAANTAERLQRLGRK